MTMPADPTTAQAVPGMYRADQVPDARLAAPRPAPGVRFALDRQADSLARMENALEILEDRLGAVLRPVPPTPGPGLGGPLPVEPQPPCAVAVEVHGRTDRLEEMLGRVQRITDWVDV